MNPSICAGAPVTDIGCPLDHVLVVSSCLVTIVLSVDLFYSFNLHNIFLNFASLVLFWSWDTWTLILQSQPKLQSELSFYSLCVAKACSLYTACPALALYSILNKCSAMDFGISGHLRAVIPILWPSSGFRTATSSMLLYTPPPSPIYIQHTPTLRRCTRGTTDLDLHFTRR